LYTDININVTYSVVLVINYQAFQSSLFYYLLVLITDLFVYQMRLSNVFRVFSSKLVV